MKKKRLGFILLVVLIMALSASSLAESIVPGGCLETRWYIGR